MSDRIEAPKNNIHKEDASLNLLADLATTPTHNEKKDATPNLLTELAGSIHADTEGALAGSGVSAGAIWHNAKISEFSGTKLSGGTVRAVKEAAKDLKASALEEVVRPMEARMEGLGFRLNPSAHNPTFTTPRPFVIDRGGSVVPPDVAPVSTARPGELLQRPELIRGTNRVLPDVAPVSTAPGASPGTGELFRTSEGQRLVLTQTGNRFTLGNRPVEYTSQLTPPRLDSAQANGALMREESAAWSGLKRGNEIINQVERVEKNIRVQNLREGTSLLGRSIETSGLRLSEGGMLGQRIEAFNGALQGAGAELRAAELGHFGTARRGAMANIGAIVTAQVSNAVVDKFVFDSPASSASWSTCIADTALPFVAMTKLGWVPKVAVMAGGHAAMKYWDKWSEETANKPEE